MRSKTSCYNPTIFRKNMLHYWPIWVIYTLYTLFNVPVMICLRAVVQGVNYTEEEIIQEKTFYYIATLGNALDPLVCAIVGLVCALAVFSYLYNARSTHAYHSFPVTRRELFVTNYFSGVLLFTIPLLLSFTFGVFACALKGITLLEYMLYWFLLMEGMCFLFYNLTILIGMLTGQIFAIPVLFIIVNYLYVGGRYLVTFIMGQISYGLMGIYDGRISSLLSPLAFLRSKVSLDQIYDDAGGHQYYLGGANFVAIYTVVAVILGLISYFLYKKRKVEITGDILSVRWLKPIMRWIFAAAAAILFSLALTTILPLTVTNGKEFVIILISTFVVGILGFFISDMILERKANVFCKKRLIECVVYSALMLLLLVGIELDVSGTETKQPQLEEIKAAYISLNYPLFEDDASGIQEILAIHKQIIDTKDEFEAYRHSDKMDSCRYVSVHYILKDGTPFIRNYYIPYDETVIADKDSIAAKLRAKSCDPDLYMKGMFCTNYDEMDFTNVSIEIYDEKLNSHMTDLDEALIDGFLAALKQDVAAGHLLGKLEYATVEEDDYNYWNYAMIELSGKNMKRTYDYYYRMYENETVSSTSQGISLNRDCVHIIKFLKKQELVNNEDRLLLTGKEYKRLHDKVEE